MEEENVEVTEVKKEKRRIVFDMEDFTLGEMCDIEDITGKDFSELFLEEFVRDPKTGRKIPDPDDPKGRPLKKLKMSMKTMLALLYITDKRDNPVLTWEQARDYKVGDVEFFAQDKDDDESPLDENEQPSASEGETSG